MLDIGCGDGRFHTSIALAEYTGLDPSATSMCRKISPTARVINQQLEQHAQSATGYDVVCAFQVLEHVPEPIQFIEMALQCLRPGGLLLLGMPNQLSYVGGLMNFALNSPPHHLSGWSDEALRAVELELALQRIDLRHAPLENWERELYWMQRCYRWKVPQHKRYSPAALWNWLIPMAYIAAKVCARVLPDPKTLQGSTMLWVATR